MFPDGRMCGIQSVGKQDSSYLFKIAAGFIEIVCLITILEERSCFITCQFLEKMWRQKSRPWPGPTKISQN